MGDAGCVEKAGEGSRSSTTACIDGTKSWSVRVHGHIHVMHAWRRTNKHTFLYLLAHGLASRALSVPLPLLLLAAENVAGPVVSILSGYLSLLLCEEDAVF